MFDNMCIDTRGYALIQEDPGNNAYNAKIWQVDLITGQSKIIAKHDAARFDPFIANIDNGTIRDLSGVVPEQDFDKALREAEDHLRHTVELNPQIPWTADPQGRITGFSERWLREPAAASKPMPRRIRPTAP